MTRQTKVTWQYVALAVTISGFVLGLFALIPDDQPQMRMALFSLLIAAGQASVGRWVVGRVRNDLEQHVRRAQRLVAEMRRRDGSDVSRETKRNGGKR